MEIKTIIVILVCLSLVGSVAWVMPTPVQRAQAKIRQLAMAKGLQIKVGKLQGPREQGEIAPQSHLATATVCHGPVVITGPVVLQRSKNQHGKYLKRVGLIPKVCHRVGAGIVAKVP